MKQKSYQVGQSINDIQQELNTLRQTVDSWNDEEEGRKEEHQDDVVQDNAPELPIQEGQDMLKSHQAQGVC